MVSRGPPWAVPQLGSCASSGRASRRWAARHSQEEAGPLGAQPSPRVLKRAASKAADVTAFDLAGGFMCQMYIKNNRSGIGGGLGGRGNPEEEGTELLGCMPRGR